MIPVRAFTWTFAYPTTEEPKWSHKVDRWYQLDASAYGLTELYERVAASGAALPPPAMILLGSACASNDSDWLFASTGATSAHKFAHTLPNIRSSALSQAMGWSGPMLCLQKDPYTLGHTLGEAAGLVAGGTLPIWVLSVIGREGAYSAGLFEFGANSPGENSSLFIEQSPEGVFNTPDPLVFDWFTSGSGSPLSLPGGYRILKKGNDT